MNWSPGSGVAFLRWNDTNHIGATGGKMKDRFHLTGTLYAESYTVTWKEVTTFPDGSFTVAEMSEDVPGNGNPTNGVYSAIHERDVPPIEESITEIDREVLISMPTTPGSGSAGGGAANGQAGGCSFRQTKAAATSANAGGLSLNISMGTDLYGASMGYLTLYASTPSFNLYAPEALGFWGITSSNVLVVTNMDGSLRQVYAPQALADIPGPPTTNGHSINFYYSSRSVVLLTGFTRFLDHPSYPGLSPTPTLARTLKSKSLKPTPLLAWFNRHSRRTLRQLPIGWPSHWEVSASETLPLLHSRAISTPSAIPFNLPQDRLYNKR